MDEIAAVVGAGELSLPQARGLSQKIRDQFDLADVAVADLSDMIYRFDAGKGWEVMGYSTFESWAAKTLPWARSRCFALRQEATVRKSLIGPDIPTNRPVPGSHLRLLAKVDAPDRGVVYRKACDFAPMDENGEPMVEERHVAKAVRAYLADRQRETVAPAGDIVDGAGNAVTDPGLRAVFAAGPGFEAVLSLLGTLRKEIKKLADQPGGAILHHELDQVERHRSHIATVVRWSRPHLPCPWCKGTGLVANVTCRPCRGHRFVNAEAVQQKPAAVS